ncbi:MAG: M48 family metalloprotease [Bdellovibrionia bacterium]
MKNLKLLVLSFLILASCATMKSAMHAVGVATGDSDMQKAESKLSPSQQYYFGRTIAANFFGTSPYVADKAVSEYVNLVGQYVAHHATVVAKGGSGPFKGFHFAVINNGTPMAMSAPGGFIFISSGMIVEMKSEDQLAGVLAHEMGHVMYEHGLQEIENEALKKGAIKGVQKIAELAGAKSDDPAAAAVKAEGFAKVIDSGINVLANQPHSREHETDADKYATKLMLRAGYSVNEYLDLVGEVKSGGLFTKHPGGEHRLKAVREALGTNKSKDTSMYRSTRFAKFKVDVSKAVGGVRTPASK